MESNHRTLTVEHKSQFERAKWEEDKDTCKNSHHQLEERAQVRF